MSPSKRKYWDVEESQVFRDQANELFPNPGHQDKTLEGVTWVLARNPYEGKETDQEGVWAIPTDAWPSSKAVTIYYRIEERSVTLLGIRESPEIT